MDSKKIIMNFTVPPSLEDLEAIAAHTVDCMPEELVDFCDGLEVSIEDFPEESILQELDLDDPFDLLALYKSGKELSPGVEKKQANDNDMLWLYRRAILDLWCDTNDDLETVMRQIIIEEIGRRFDFSEDEIEDMAERHYQGML